MKVFLDSDAVPIRNIAINICREEKVEIILVKNYSQDFTIDYGEIINVDISPDAADLYIVNHGERGDLVLTNDRGLSSMALARNLYVMDFNGNIIDEKNISSYLNQRYISKVMRNKGDYTHFKKRKKSENENFELELRKLLRRIKND